MHHAASPRSRSIPRRVRGAGALAVASAVLVLSGVVPAPQASAAVGAGRAAAGPGARCSLSTGRYQREVERQLRLKVDGRQSAADCRAIQRYQRKRGVEPANGIAGAVTYTALYARWARAHPKKLRGCPYRRTRLVCVDLNHQVLWVKQGKRTVVAPVPIRSGRPGHLTRTGWFRVNWRHKDHWSTIYRTPMPYSQFFNGGQAFHGILGNLFKNPASYGCVNLQLGDAKRLWKTLRKGDRVYVWGRRPVR